VVAATATACSPARGTWSSGFALGRLRAAAQAARAATGCVFCVGCALPWGLARRRGASAFGECAAAGGRAVRGLGRTARA
jgi:hypothetical protein